MLRDLFNPNYAISTILDGIDLSGVHFAACLMGALMAIYVMQLWSHGSLELQGDCFVAKYARRFSLLILTLSMLWSIAYSTTKGWQPWPPDLFGLLAVDLFLASNILVALKRKRALG